MIKNKYVPSVNILRDSYREIKYIPTPNGNRIANLLVSNFKLGLRAFNLIGSYGTGKSSFLVAFKQSIAHEKRYFDVEFVSNANFNSISIIGEYNSLITIFANILNVKINKNVVHNIFSEIYNRYAQLATTNSTGFLLIEIDEFGKFLEFAAQNNPESELYFIQQLAEFVGNPDWNILLLTTIHQSFDSYAYALSSSQKQDWTKVKGRFNEITFNEPIEQLLFLASEHIVQHKEEEFVSLAINECLELFLDAKAFNSSDSYTRDIIFKIYPLDIFAANVLTLSLQRYAQNERSMFSFLESADHTSLNKFNPSEIQFYNLGSLYDYLVFNFHHFLASKYNPDFALWANIREGIEIAERLFEFDVNTYIVVIKAIGLFNIFASKGARLGRDFYFKYLSVCCGILNVEEIITKLEQNKIIRYRFYNDSFVFFEGTDLDIQTALMDAASKISEITDVPSLLTKYFDFTPILAKAYSFRTGTPRYFNYIFSGYPTVPRFDSEIDGFVNFIFNEQLGSEDVNTFSSEVEDAVLFCLFTNTKEIKLLLFEIEKTKKVIEGNSFDKIALKELNALLAYQLVVLNDFLVYDLYKKAGSVTWSFHGIAIVIDSKRGFNRTISNICGDVYSGTPVFKSELVNRPKLPGSIATARRNFFGALTNCWSLPNLGFDDSKFPPEKSIYLALLKENGIFTGGGSSQGILIREDSSFNLLWNACIKFLNLARKVKSNLQDLVSILRNKPFRLKEGFISVWVPTFVFLNRSDISLFSNDGFISTLTSDHMDLISKSPRDYYVKTIDIGGIKAEVFNSYRLLMERPVEGQITNSSFIDTIKPFLSFYRKLPNYTKDTKRLSKNASAIKVAIANSVDPEVTFFEDFPIALGTSIKELQENKAYLVNFSHRLSESISEIRESYPRLIDRIDEFIQIDICGSAFSFLEYKAYLFRRFDKIKKHLLLPHHKPFIQRVKSGLDERDAWINSICQSLIGKTLDDFQDSDEIILYDKFKTIIFELDSLLELADLKFDENVEDIISIQFNSPSEGIQKSLIRFPKSKSKKINSTSMQIKSVLSDDKEANIVALSRLLQEFLKK